MLGFMCWYRATPGRGCAGAAQAKSGRGGASPPQKMGGAFMCWYRARPGRAGLGRGGTSRVGPGRRKPGRAGAAPAEHG